MTANLPRVQLGAILSLIERAIHAADEASHVLIAARLEECRALIERDIAALPR